MRLRWLPEAFQDLEGIYAYLLANRPAYAQTTIQQIYEAVHSLKAHPFLGRPGRRPSTRELVVNRLPYIVFYRVHEEAIEILYVRHGAQDVRRS